MDKYADHAPVDKKWHARPTQPTWGWGIVGSTYAVIPPAPSRQDREGKITRDETPSVAETREIIVFPGGTPDMQQLLQQAQQMQQDLMSAQDELAQTEVKGTSGGGLVTATVNGVGELQRLEIKPEACDPDDTETLADLVVAAVLDAGNNAKAVASKRLGPLAEGLGGMPGGLGLPGQ